MPITCVRAASSRTSRRFAPSLTAPASASGSAPAASVRARSPRPRNLRELVTAAGTPRPIGPYSPALKVGNLLFLSGSIPLDPLSGQLVSGGIVEQTTRVMENIKTLLDAG